MSDDRVEIVVCPDSLVSEALAIALRDLALEQRAEIAQVAHQELSPPKSLFVALDGSKLSDAAWGQLQPGNTAILWLPQRSEDVGRRLAQCVVESLDREQVRMSQAVLSEHSAATEALLRATGYEHLAELLYLSCAPSNANGAVLPTSLEFQAVQESQLPRFAKLIEATYAETKDCPAMNGRRPMHEVLEGYRATGQFRPENWLIVQAEHEDIGVLIVAEYENSDFAELVYMGILPRFRGCGFGKEIALYAQQHLRSANVERLLVAVDAANAPALAMYEHAGFTVWNRREVYVRFCQSVA